MRKVLIRIDFQSEILKAKNPLQFRYFHTQEVQTSRKSDKRRQINVQRETVSKSFSTATSTNSRIKNKCL